MRVAAVQMTSTRDKDANFETATRLVADAVHEGAELVVVPEMFNCLGSGDVLRDGAEPLEGRTSTWGRAQARDHGIWFLAGSFVERVEGEKRTHNTSCLYAPDGERVACYRKIHMFDCDVPGAEFHESEVSAPGNEIVVADAGELRLGLTVCYDLRFPELYRIEALRGATAVALPAAFTAKTGPPHWEVLIRARAIENQVFMIAAGQRARSNETLHWHGHSMIVDPWGTILAEAPDSDGVVVADCDLAELARIRKVLPSLANRQPAAYRWPDPPAATAPDADPPTA